MLKDIGAFGKGLRLTFKHLFKLGKPYHATTFNYPEEKRPQSPRFRGVHKLQRHPDGLERCVACSLCSVACPSDAIFVKAAENDPKSPVSQGERFADVYQIDMLRCIFCGFCEEACPEDAVVLGSEWEIAHADRAGFVFDKTEMLVSEDQKDDFRPGMTWPKQSALYSLAKETWTAGRDIPTEKQQETEETKA